MNIKRFFTLTVAALLLSTAACGGVPDVIPTAGDIETTAPVENTDALKEIVFEKLSIYESDMCSIVITSINADNPSGYTLNLSISRNTEDEEYIDIEYIYETNEEGESDSAAAAE